MNAIDTNILVYAFSADEEHKSLVARQLLLTLDPADTVILWQVAVEFGAVLSRLKKLDRIVGSEQDAWRSVRSRFRLVTPQPAVLDRAAEIRSSRGASYWDSMILASCVEAGVTTLYTEDRQSATEIDGVRIISPFV